MITAQEFRQRITSITSREIVQTLILDGHPYCFEHNLQLYYDFRSKICDEFGIHPQNFVVVGSAKMGFSLAPDKYGRKFSHNSDIDVVLVSEDLFRELWLSLLDFRGRVLGTLDKRYRDRFNDLQHQFFYGMIRFDKITDHFPYAKKWWSFFNTLSRDAKFGPRRVRGTVFQSWHYVTKYYEYSIEKLHSTISWETT